MKVKAKWAVKVNGKWHNATETFEVESLDGLEDAVEVIEGAKEPETAETEAEPEVQAEPKPKAAARTRRKITDK